jgi:hypothetical protein
VAKNTAKIAMLLRAMIDLCPLRYYNINKIYSEDVRSERMIGTWIPKKLASGIDSDGMS